MNGGGTVTHVTVPENDGRILWGCVSRATEEPDVACPRRCLFGQEHGELLSLEIGVREFSQLDFRRRIIFNPVQHCQSGGGAFAFIPLPISGTKASRELL